MKHKFELTRGRVLLASAALACLGLVACSGDEDGVYPPDPNKVPASAGASVSAFVSYLQNLAASETTEPLGLEDVTPPTDETSEPSPLP